MSRKFIRTVAAVLAAFAVAGCSAEGIVSKTAKLELPEKVVTADVGGR